MTAFAQYWRQVFRDFGKHNCMLVAAALSFYALLSVLPIAMLLIALLGHVLGSDEQAQRQTLAYLHEAIPSAGTRSIIEETVREIIAGRQTVTKLGAVALLWTGSQLFMTLQAALNVVWNVEQPRGWVVKRIISLLATLSLGLLALLSFGINAFSAMLKRLGAPLLAKAGLATPWLWKLGAATVALALLFLSFLLVYRLLPSLRVRWREAGMAAAIATVLWVAAREVFAWYLTDIATVYRVYGSLGGVIAVMLWGFYSAVLILFAAEVAAHYWRRPKTDSPPSTAAATGDKP